MPVVISGGGAVATVADTPQIDLGLTNAQLTADVVAGSIGSTQLSSAVNSALTLAGTAVQPAALTSYLPLSGGALTGAVTSTSTITTRQSANTVQSLVVSGTTQTIDWNNGGSINLDLSSASGNVTLTLQNPVSGATYRMRVQQGATVRNLTFPAGTVQQGDGGNVYTGIAGVDFLTVYYNGSAYLVQSALNSGFTLSAAAITAAYQPLSGDLTAISALAGTTGIARKTAANTWTLDTTQAPQSNLPYWPLGSAITTANNGTDATNDIDFVANGKAVQCRDASGNMLWVTPAAGTVTKRADAAWASGSGNGGMGSGLTFSTSTEYYFFLITNGTSIDYGFDTSITAANLQTSTGWAYYRPVGWLKSTSPLAWRSYKMDGVWFWWTGATEYTTTVGGASNVVNLDAPTGFNCLGKLRVTSGAATSTSTPTVSIWYGRVSETAPASLIGYWNGGTALAAASATSSLVAASSDVRLVVGNIDLLIEAGQIRIFGYSSLGAVSSAASWASSSAYPGYCVRGFSLENLING